MTRSIHTTKKQLEQERLNQYADPARHQSELDQLSQQLSLKRRIKRQLRAGQPDGRTDLPATSPDAIPIVTESGEHLLHPASPDDIRAVLRQLPGGVPDGLAEIRLSLGEYRQQEANAEGERNLQPDPWMGRLGYELFPGLYSGAVMGTYHRPDAIIALYGYVLAPDLPDREMWSLYLRQRTLAVLLHEIAHHYDCVRRVARGRWRFDSVDAAEFYANGSEHRWLPQVIVPYLKQAYPDAVRQFAAWLEHHVGLALPLEIAAGDARVADRQGNPTIRSFFQLDFAIFGLAEEVYAGRPVEETRLLFARELHYAEYYEEALQVIAGLTAARPDFWAAHALAADIFVHQNRLPEAEARAGQILAAAPQQLEALDVLLDIHRKREEWPAMEALAGKMLALVDMETDLHEWCLILEQRIQARVRQGRVAAAENDLKRLTEEGKDYGRRRAERLRRRFFESSQPES